jgi:hypothetical protein
LPDWEREVGLSHAANHFAEKRQIAEMNPSGPEVGIWKLPFGTKARRAFREASLL